MSYQNLTTGRYSETGRAYSLTMVTDRRIPHFNDFAKARYLINEMRTVHDSGLLESLAWGLMPDHLHWLLVVNETELSEVVRIFKGKSSFDFKKSFHHNGAFWQRGFYDHALRKEEDLRAAARYIVANPLRAGLVETIGEYSHWDAAWVVY
ncbi:transposase [Methylococcaceae bacterium HT4]|nr:transposase [Methylococcaceae bacterium CS4]TXK98704.1 transposase [Methylococcaceae bacterium CS5]TXL07361.1 transposase [Methylococcaceae bacterium CS3]TXL09902.1 transposase [Methylococcaceae bacterium CS2]TXL13809.1 transposase [Methylococcaceae bacterium HT4]TXL19328.1 transposase [Methylococcaceae bacterium HT5]